MAIAFDAASGISSAAATSLTFSHTCTGSNRLLVVGILVYDIGDKVTGVTYAGVAMTRTAIESGGPDHTIWMYHLAAPATGANNVVVSLSSSDSVLAGAISLTGVAQTGLPDVSGTNYSGTAGNTITKAVTTVADNCWLVGVGYNWHENTITAGANTTVRTSAGMIGVGDSNGAKSPAGSYSLTFNTSFSDKMGIIVASFPPFVAPPFIPKIIIT